MLLNRRDRSDRLLLAYVVIVWAIIQCGGNQPSVAKAGFVGCSKLVTVGNLDHDTYASINREQSLKLGTRNSGRRNYSVELVTHRRKGRADINRLSAPLHELRKGCVKNHRILAFTYIHRRTFPEIGYMPRPHYLPRVELLPGSSIHRGNELWLAEVISKPDIRTLVLPELIPSLRETILCGFSRVLPGLGTVRDFGSLFLDLGEGLIHRIRLLSSVARVQDDHSKGNYFQPRFWLTQKFLGFIKKSALLCGGLACLVCSLILIRAGVPSQRHWLGSVAFGVSGLVMFFCAQDLLWRFMDLLGW